MRTFYILTLCVAYTICDNHGGGGGADAPIPEPEWAPKPNGTNSSSAGTTCTAGFNMAFGCVLPKAMKIKSTMPKPPSSDKVDAMTVKIGMCFTDNGCKLPDASEFSTLPTPLQNLAETAANLGVTGLDLKKMQATMETGLKCGKQLQKKMKPILEQCAQQSDPLLADFKLPDLDSLMKLMGTEDGMSMDLVPTVGMLLKRAADEMNEGMAMLGMLVAATYNPYLCPNGIEQSRTVRKCVEAAIDEITPEEMKCSGAVSVMYRIMDVKTEMCNAVQGCIDDNLSDECKDLKENKLADYMCSCLEKIVDKNWNMMRDEMTKCMATEMGEKLNIPDYFVAKNGPVYSFTVKMLRNICAAAKDRENDICNNYDWVPELGNKGVEKKNFGQGWGKGGAPKKDLPPPPAQSDLPPLPPLSDLDPSQIANDFFGTE